MGELLPSFAFAFGASLASVIGGVMVTRFRWAARSLRYFIALSAGFMLGTVFIELAPDSFQLTPSAPKMILLGYLIVHLFEHTFAAHLHFGEETHHHEVSRPAVEFSALVGLLVHTFFDGVLIGASLQVSRETVLLVFLAVFLHKIPDGFTISSIFINAGHTAGRAHAAAMSLGVSTIIGALAVSFIGGGLVKYALPISTGSLLYVAATDLMPEANRESGVRMAFIVFAGIALFYGIKALVAH
jgi:ZIP family zinc transporter/zinc and cadmium transporter